MLPRPPLATAAPALAAALFAAGCDDTSADNTACEPPATLSSLRLTVDGTRLRDAFGREVLLRGVNTGGRSKTPPFFPFEFRESGFPGQEGAPPFDEAVARYLDRVVDWGHNVVRAPFSWEGIEPERGRYDDAYLARYEAFVEAAAARGLRVIVDFHQDVYARPYCGDGFPLWSCPTPLPEEPPVACEQWFTGYLQPGPVQTAFDRFWAGEDGLIEAFEAMWRHVAVRLWTAEHDNVIGFEIINEPGFGSADPDTFAREVLTPFYSRLAAVLNEAAPGALILFDATGPDAAVAATALELPAGDDLVFAPHYYHPAVYLDGAWSKPTADFRPHLGRWAELGATWDVPVLLGEFGMSPRRPGVEVYLRASYDGLDAHALHGTVWEYSESALDWNAEGMSLIEPDGRELPAVAEVVRPYPRAVAGTLVAFSYDAERGEAVLVYDAQAGGLTELVAPARHYPGGPSVSVEGGDACVATRTGLVSVRASAAARLTVRVHAQP